MERYMADCGLGRWPYQSPLPSPRARELEESPSVLLAAAEAKLEENVAGIVAGFGV